jgi:hypothetical protein
MLAARMETATQAAASAERTAPAPAPDAGGDEHARRAGGTAAVGGGTVKIGTFLNSREGKALQREVTRGVFGLLKKAL